MKKRIFRKGICAGLILAMVMGLCACGGGGKGTQSADPSLAKQFVFSSGVGYLRTWRRYGNSFCSTEG